MDSIRNVIYDYFNLPFHVRLELAKKLDVFHEEDINLKPTNATQKWCEQIVGGCLVDKLKDLFVNEYLKYINKEKIIDNENNTQNTLLDNIDFQNELVKLGFNRLCSGWFENKDKNIRIRLWNDCQVDFWLWNSPEYNQLHFRGIIYTIEDVKWVIERCFSLYY